jgi:uncharacterized membrane protein
MIDIARGMSLLLHGLAGAAWFGSMFYSIFVLYPRMCRYFTAISERERFMLALSHGARWHMVSAIALVAVSGIGLALLPRERMTAAWLTLIGVKTALLIASAIFFWRISWHWWPARLFALESELPTLHRRFRIAAACMFVMVGANAALGLVGRLL